MADRNILLLFFHPRYEDSRANKVLLEAVKDLPFVKLHDLYEAYPDFNIFVKREQELLSQYGIIVWQHPFFWYSCPPLMKQWLDLVLEYGWAYGEGGQALKGKYFMNALTSAGTFEVYRKGGRNRFTYRELLSPYDQTVYLCQGHYLAPFIVPGAPRLSEEALNNYARRYRVLLEKLHSEEGFAEQLCGQDYANPLLEQL